MPKTNQIPMTDPKAILQGIIESGNPKTLENLLEGIITNVAELIKHYKMLDLPEDQALDTLPIPFMMLHNYYLFTYKAIKRGVIDVDLAADIAKEELTQFTNKHLGKENTNEK